MEYELTVNNLHIVNSYRVRKWNMRKELQRIKDDAGPGQTRVFWRSIFSLKMEWICHNFLYNVGYQRERTRDSDLDYPCDRPEWQYIVCALLVWLFVW
jgi:hypothetical protein